MPENHTPDERYALNLPYLTIPYWDTGQLSSADPGDKGDIRPVPPGVISYLCQGIVPTTLYKPGDTLSVVVAVRNWGGGNNAANAIVSVWWELPATSFSKMVASQLLGVRSVVVPPRGQTANTLPLTKVIPATAPAHICLVARVDHPLDPVPTKPDGSQTPAPGVDRHWAQRNIVYVAPDMSGVINFPFWAGGPSVGQEEFVFQVQPFMRETLVQLTRIVRAEPIHMDARFEIRETRDLLDVRSEKRSSHPYLTSLHAGSRRSMHLRVNIGRIPEKGEFAAFQLLQLRRQDERPAGGIALIVVAPESNR